MESGNGDNRRTSRRKTDRAGTAQGLVPATLGLAVVLSTASAASAVPVDPPMAAPQVFFPVATLEARESDPSLSVRLRTAFTQSIPIDAAQVSVRYTVISDSAKVGVARLRADGTPDETFHPGPGAGGSALGARRIESVAVQSDGRILVGGCFSEWNGVPRHGLARRDAGTEVLLESSTDLVEWRAIAAFPHLNGLQTWSEADGHAPGTPARFFRARCPL
jgi:hypothetical protein